MVERRRKTTKKDRSREGTKGEKEGGRKEKRKEREPGRLPRGSR